MLNKRACLLIASLLPATFMAPVHAGNRIMLRGPWNGVTITSKTADADDTSTFATASGRGDRSGRLHLALEARSTAVTITGIGSSARFPTPTASAQAVFDLATVRSWTSVSGVAIIRGTVSGGIKGPSNKHADVAVWRCASGDKRPIGSCSLLFLYGEGDAAESSSGTFQVPFTFGDGRACQTGRLPIKMVFFATASAETLSSATANVDLVIESLHLQGFRDC